MVIVRLAGGIGNQLFQYGLAYTIGKRIGSPVLLDISSFQGNKIRSFMLNELYPEAQVLDYGLVKTLVEPNNIVLRSISRWAGWKRLPKVVESHTGYVPQIGAIDYPCYLKGSFISFKYFEEVSDEWLGKMEFADSYKNQALRSMQPWVNQNVVCVSIRRGDFLDYESLNVCNKQYYLDCITYCRQTLDNPVFLFFSDDIDWVQQEFHAKDFAYWHVPDYAVVMKLYAMMQCQHYIISNSSYSWWGAWLGKNPDKTVCCPAKVVADNSFPVDDYYPRHWVRIEP